MAFPHTIYGKYGWEKVTGTSKKHKLGTRMEHPDGRIFYYALANGALGAGNLAMQLNHHSGGHIKDRALIASAALGATTVLIKSSKATVIADYYADGYIYVNDMGTGTRRGEGYVYRVKSHVKTPGTHTSATLTLILDEEDGIQEEALASTLTEIGLRANPFRDVETWDASDIDGRPVGVPNVDVANNEYFWCQTWGPSSVLTEGTVVLGNVVVPTASKIGGIAHGTGDGAVIAMAVLQSHAATATSKVQPHVADQNVLSPVGIVESVGASTEYSLIFLTISR
tara:strand:+ start:5494 stop:6342 length:849 start_codon:yes stop_codon:yes gene_type:complete